jgi:hypothetical protein
MPHHRSLTWATLNQSTPPHRIHLRTILILSSVLRLVFRLQFYRHFSCFASASYALPTSSSLIHLPTKIRWTEQIKNLILQFSPVISSHHQILSSAQCSRTHLNRCCFQMRFFLLHALPCFNTSKRGGNYAYYSLNTAHRLQLQVSCDTTNSDYFPKRHKPVYQTARKTGAWIK